MRAAALLAAAVLALAAPAPAQEGAAEDRAALIAALRANGCALTEAEGALRGPGARPGAVAALVAEGAAAWDGDRLALVGTVCAGSSEPPGGPLSALVAAAAPGACEVRMADALAALAGQGIGKAELSAIVADLVAAGDAAREGPLLRLDRGLCAGMPGSPSTDVRRRVAAVAWLDARLAAAPGCAAPRATLAREGVAVAIGPADLDQAVADLVARGRGVAGEAVALLPAACPAGPAGRVAALGLPAVRAAVGLEVLALGCRVPLGPEASAALAPAVAGRLGLDPADPEARAALAARVADVLDNPGPAYHTEAGDLVLLRCTP